MNLAAFLRRELAPAPGRLRGTLRIAVGCLAATLSGYVIGASISPHAHWVITTVFTVSQPDVGASLRKAGQRLVGTVIGGGLGILAVVAFADLPVLYVPVLGAVVALGLFLSMTSTAPYVMMLGTLTFVLVSFIPGDSAATAVHNGIWRIFAIVIGVVIGSGTQLVLWPDDPEKRLRRVLAARLSAIAASVERIAADRGSARPALSASLGGDNLTAQLDLLASAEARHPSLRQRHTEQLTIILEVDRLVTTSAWLAGASPRWDAAAVDDAIWRELAAIARECRQLAGALDAGRPPAGAPPELGPSLRAPAPPGARPVLDDTRLALERTRNALGFLDPSRPLAPALDHPKRTPLLTDAFSMANTQAVGLALKAAFALVISYVLMHALSWPAMSTAAITAVLVAQTSFGATVQKSILRLGGAAFGGLLGLAAILVAMPNLESLGGILVVAFLGFLVSAWIMMGSARISYVGLQTGMAFAMCVTDPPGPSVDLAVGRDRVIGILVGVLAMLFVNAALWPVRARVAMRPTLARALRSIGELARLAPTTGQYRAQLQRAVQRRSSIYNGLAATLRVSAESEAEPDGQTPDAIAERNWIARLTADAQAVFLSLLALIRHRVSPGFPELPGDVRDAFVAYDRAVAETLDAIAQRIERGPAVPVPDLAARFAEVESRVGAPVASGAGAVAAAARVAEQDHAAIGRDLLGQMNRLLEAVEARPDGTSR